MASAGVYKQNRLASQMFGTPGVDRSAGQAFGVLAQGAGQIRRDMQEADSVRNYNIISGITAVGQFLGQAAQKAKQNAQNKQAYKNMLEDMDLARAESGFTDAANGMMANMQNEDYLDRPDEAQQPFRDFLNQQGDLLYERFQNSPRALAKLTPMIEGAKSKYNDRMTDWSFQRRTVNAQQDAKNVRPQALEKISRIRQTDFRNATQEFNDILDQNLGLLVKQTPALGKRFVEGEGMALRQAAGPTFFKALMNNRPRDPQAELSYIADVRSYVEQADNLGIFLDADDRSQLNNQIDREEGQAYTQLEKKNQVDEIATSNRILYGRVELDNNFRNGAMQNEAIQMAAQQAKAITLEVEQIKSDPKLNDKAKLALIKTKNTQINLYHSLAETARANLRDIDREAKADAREGRAAGREAAREAKAAMRVKAADANAELADMRLQLRTLISENPVANAKEIINLSARIHTAAVNGRQAGYITDTRALGASTEALNTAKRAAEYRPEPGMFIGIKTPFGNLGTQTNIGADPNKFERMTGADTLTERTARQAEYINQMKQAAYAMEQRDNETKKSVQLGLNARQQAEFDEVAEILRGQNLPPAVLKLKLNQARNIAASRNRSIR